MTLNEPAVTIETIGHGQAQPIAEEAYARFATLLESVPPEDWSRPTDCEGWTVRDLAGHMLGAMRSASSLREFLAQQRQISRRVKRTGENEIDVMTAVQIEITAELSHEEVIEELRRLVLPAARGRHRTPAPLRRWVSFPVEFGTTSERWKLGYLLDVVLTRDAWLHRIDLARAVNVEPTLTADHDGRIVADIVAEWGRRHGHPVRLTLTGPAGGTFELLGEGKAEEIVVDAVDFCRTLSGREQGTGLMAVDVPF